MTLWLAHGPSPRLPWLTLLVSASEVEAVTVAAAAAAVVSVPAWASLAWVLAAVQVLGVVVLNAVDEAQVEAKAEAEAQFAEAVEVEAAARVTEEEARHTHSLDRRSGYCRVAEEHHLPHGFRCVDGHAAEAEVEDHQPPEGAQSPGTLPRSQLTLPAFRVHLKLPSRAWHGRDHARDLFVSDPATTPQSPRQ